MSSEVKREGQEDQINEGPVHGTSEGTEPQTTTRPSQAEGDRETINEDLREKEGEEGR